MLTTLGLPFSKWPLLLVAGDLIIYCLTIPFGIAFGLNLAHVNLFYLDQFKIPLALIALTYTLVLYVANLYDHYQDFRRRENIGRIILSSLLGTLLVLIIFTFPGRNMIDRSFIQWQAVAFVWLLALWRYSFSAVALPIRLQRRVLILGAGRAGSEILRTLNRHRNSGLLAAGFVDDNPQKQGTVHAGLQVLGTSGQLEEIVATQKIGLVVDAITHDKSPAVLTDLVRLSFHGVQVVDMPSLYEFLAAKIPTDHISDIWLFLHSLNKNTVYYRHFKRIFDLALAAVGLLVIWPLFLIIGIAIKLDTAGPVFFRQERSGKDGKAFQIVKFRTMVQDAERMGPRFADHDDPRITRVGRILRKWRLDEWPQLYNIVKGEMSFIGPRPEREVFIREFRNLVPELREGRRTGDAKGCRVLCGYRERIPYYSYRLLIKPGITGWAQVMHPYTATLEETKEKLQYDLYYIKNMGLFLDLAILLKTIRIVLFGWGR